jgi:hypothetical protein
MRARLIIPSDGPNPDYNPKLPDSRETNWPYILMPVGTVLVGPKCWIHCLPEQSGIPGVQGVIRAEPDDEECQARVDRHNGYVAPILARRELGALKRSEQTFESETL